MNGNFSGTTLRDQFLLLCMITNDENNYILFCKREVLNVLEGTASKVFSGAKLPGPYFPTTCLFYPINFPASQLHFYICAPYPIQASTDLTMLAEFHCTSPTYVYQLHSFTKAVPTLSANVSPTSPIQENFLRKPMNIVPCGKDEDFSIEI